MPPATEREFVAQPVAAAGGRVIISPFQFATAGDDNFRVEGWSSITGAVLVLSGRRFDEKGREHPFVQRVPLSSDRLVTERDFQLGAGYLGNAMAYVEGAEPLIGQVFCCIKLIRGLTGASIVLGALIQGYVTHEQVRAWPGSPLETSDSGPGCMRTLTGTDPAAGAEISETVPTGARWELTAIGFTLVSDATVATRRPNLFLDDGTLNDYFRSANPGTQTASSSNRYHFAPSMPLAAIVGGTSQLGGLITPHIMPAGHRIRTATNSLQAGDNYGSPTYVVREWLEAN